MRRFFVAIITVCFLLVNTVSAQVGPNPPHDGEFDVVGLNDTVEILRDEWGVPHIYASNVYDLFFAQGYTQAMDRWWQMEFARATSGGRIQELTGYNPALMGTDAYLRTLGLHYVAEQEYNEVYSDEMRFILDAFTDGVNAYIFGVDELNDLAYEYRVLGITGVQVELAPWTPVDTLAWGKIMALQLGGNQGFEQLFSRLVADLDPELLEDYYVQWPFGEKPTILFPEDLPITGQTLSTAQLEIGSAGIAGIETAWIGGFEIAQLDDFLFGHGVGIGSNNWVAHGAITETGAPLMANDMHLSLDMPSIWYEIGLHCQPVSDECPYQMAGFTFPASPLVVAGHNDNISWALTNVGPDTQDLYQIVVNPEDDLQYEWDGEWRDMTVRDETLSFGDGTDPIDFQVRHTHLGPIINDDLDGFNNDNPLALRWTAHEPGELFATFEGLARAENWDDFRDALRFFDSPSQNMIYADTQGNIGYQTPGKIPIRAPEHTGLLPVPGNTSAFEWLGYIPFDNLPRIYNPARGFIATANQALVPLEYYDQLADELGDEFGVDANYVISHNWAYGYRGDRIVNLLEEMQPHSAATFAQMHADNYDGSAAEILPFFAELEIDDSALAEIRDWLLDWDYHYDIDSPHAALYAHLWVRLVDNIYNDELGAIGLSASGTGQVYLATYRLMQEPTNAWWNNINTAETETRDDILLLSLAEAYEQVAEMLGDDPDEWQWGDLHTITFVSNPLGLSGVSPIENQVNRGAFTMSGTNTAINATSWSPGSADFTVRAGPSQRAIYDLSDWDNSLTMHTTGQSGNPASIHYDDMIDSWRFVEYRPMPWTREAVEQATVNTLILNPAD
ncbi:MAG: penicillin acylase family protein [Anaerolineaceae bacterium]|nr:MAG: penicillin acylase family protein [Anaerolineaceae bacterium]